MKLVTKTTPSIWPCPSVKEATEPIVTHQSGRLPTLGLNPWIMSFIPLLSKEEIPVHISVENETRGALRPLQTVPVELWMTAGAAETHLFLAVSAGAPGVTFGRRHLHSVGQSACSHTTSGLQTALSLVVNTRDTQHPLTTSVQVFHYQEPLNQSHLSACHSQSEPAVRRWCRCDSDALSILDYLCAQWLSS